MANNSTNNPPADGGNQDANNSGLVDTSTAESFLGKAAESEEDDQGNFYDANMDQFDFSNIQKDPNPSTGEPPINDDKNKNKPPTDGKQTIDYKAQFAAWAKTKGHEVDVNTLGDNFGETELNQKVQEVYARQYFQDKDPMLWQLAQKGLSIKDHFEKIVPLQEQLGKSDTELYLEDSVGKAIAQDIKLGTLKADDTEAISAATTAYKTTLTEKIKSVPEDILKNLVEPIRNNIKGEIEALPTQLQQLQEQAQAQAFEEQKTNYTQLQTSMLADVDKDLLAGKNFGIPFGGQANKDGFKDFVNEQTKFGFTTKDEHGKETEVQDIPFLHRIKSDNAYLLKVLRTMYALDQGQLTDVKNTARGEVINSLQIEPVLTNIGKGTNNNSRLVDTSKGFV